MYNSEEKINVLKRVIQTYTRSRDDFHISSMDKDIAVLKEILLEEENRNDK